MHIDDHILEGATFIQSPDRGGIITPRFVVIHYTGGGPAEGSVAWLTRADDHYLSAHVVIGRDGQLTQLVPFNRKAYHAGVSEWLGVKNLNECSIGIELANYGFTPNEDEGNAIFLRKYKVPKEKCVFARHRNGGLVAWWEKFAEAQVVSCAQLCSALMATYPSISEIVGHDDIAPQRKVDPGPAFKMDVFRQRIADLVESPVRDDPHPDGVSLRPGTEVSIQGKVRSVARTPSGALDLRIES